MNFKICFISIFVIGLLNANAQINDKNIKTPSKSAMNTAEKQYNQYAYVNAIATYERIANKGYKSVELFQKLGNAYYFNSELTKANKWYQELFSISTDLEAEYYYRYSQTLKSIGDFKSSDKMMEQFKAKAGDDIRAKLFDQNKDYLEKIKNNSDRYKIEDAGINSNFMDYGGAFYNDKFVFASSRETNKANKGTWNGQSLTNLYVSNVEPDGKLGVPEKLSKKLNSQFNEDSPTFTSDSKTMYFTRNNFINGKKGKNAEKVMLLKIYKAKLIENEWDDIQELPFNSNDFSCAHPALSPDEKTLYFASDMLGTFGQSDIYKVRINSDGSYGKPENLGALINTPGKETFPFVSEENELYFASDGRPGLGGLDIYVAKINNDGSISKPINIGAPINSGADDFGFINDTKSKLGFFTSNRDGGKGFDDIYKFVETKPLPCEQKLTGVVSEQKTGELISGAVSILYDNNMVELARTNSDINGKYEFKVNCGQTYFVKSSKPGFLTKEDKITTGTKPNDEIFNILMIREVAELPTDGSIDISKDLNIIIFFDLAKSNIRPDAEVELAKLVDFMEQNPNVKIDVRSHTDSRQTAAYNLKLSDSRVKSTIAWLISKGIDAKRLSGRGYGESKLINKCKDGVECTEEEHQQNRRSEFILVK